MPGAARPDAANSPAPQGGTGFASRKDNGAIHSHGKTSAVPFYQPLAGKVLPSKPEFFCTFTYCNTVVSCAERKAAVGDTKES